MTSHPWLKTELYADYTQANCTCERCGGTTTATGHPDALRGVVERFVEHHKQCPERQPNAG